jgi:hypothetical protein
MFMMFLFNNWESLVALIALQVLSWKYWRWYYLPKAEKKPKAVRLNNDL